MSIAGRKVLVLLSGYFLLTSGCWGEASRETRLIHDEWFFVQNASIGNMDSHQNAKRSIFDSHRLPKTLHEFSLIGHHIQPGESLVIAHRNFWAGNDATPIDVCGYTKLTLWIDATANFERIGESKVYSIDSDGIGLFVSAGNANFRESGCVGYGKKGLIRINQVAIDRLRVNLDLYVMRWSVSGGKGACDDQWVSESTEVNLRDISMLSPFDGKKSMTVYHEGFPP